MNIQRQAISAAATTAVLLAIGMGIVMLDGTTASRAEPIDPAALSALQAAVNKPDGSLKALIDKMNAEQPGSGTQFVQAFNSGDTDALATALANVASGNAALQDTIASALATLAAEPNLAAIASANGINVASVVASVKTAVAAHFQAKSQTEASNQTDQNQPNTNGDLSNVNPGAPAPFAGPPGGPFNPFTGPGRSPQALSPSPNTSPAGPGQPNSRA
jgi:hypothetical protein